MEPDKTLSKTIFILVNPVTIVFYTFFLSIYIWGPGLVAFGLAIFTGFFSLISWAIFFIIKRPVNKNMRRIYMSISYVLIFAGWQCYQGYGARGENLKSVLIDKELKDEFALKESSIYFAGGESEIWLQLESNKNAIDKLIASKNFELVKESGNWKPDYFPEWWPNSIDDYYCYEFNDRYSEHLYRVVTTKDQKTVYYYYLYY